MSANVVRNRCEHGVVGCGDLRMRSDSGEEGLRFSVELRYCAKHTTEQVEQAAKALIVNVGALAGLLGASR